MPVRSPANSSSSFIENLALIRAGNVISYLLYLAATIALVIKTTSVLDYRIITSILSPNLLAINIIFGFVHVLLFSFAILQFTDSATALVEHYGPGFIITNILVSLYMFLIAYDREHVLGFLSLFIATLLITSMYANSQTFIVQPPPSTVIIIQCAISAFRAQVAYIAFLELFVILAGFGGADDWKNFLGVLILTVLCAGSWGGYFFDIGIWDTVGSQIIGWAVVAIGLERRPFITYFAYLLGFFTIVYSLKVAIMKLLTERESRHGFGHSGIIRNDGGESGPLLGCEGRRGDVEE